jgi:hypothetical protein
MKPCVVILHTQLRGYNLDRATAVGLSKIRKELEGVGKVCDSILIFRARHLYGHGMNM